VSDYEAKLYGGVEVYFDGINTFLSTRRNNRLIWLRLEPIALMNLFDFIKKHETLRNFVKPGEV